MAEWQLKDGDELDLICWKYYGDLPGALEAVLRANWEKLHLFDDLGEAKSLPTAAFITLPDLKRPTAVTNSIRIFE
ncbi:tail protein X [Oligoflexus tunisiensis]|uniref:tail protein X n=1 Tax=Oligoflexus tunisiensis TaxID=708132 RepID=UPI00114D11CC|nr:tail protein X [Oligoflexus tunisiensis]